MNHLLNAGLLSVLSVALMAADANPSSDVKAAARALGQQNFDVNRTTTVEIKDVGSTNVQVPDEAKQKL
jgi:hypothetical protein